MIPLLERARRRAIRVAWALGLAGLATAGCQYFHPATPEQPLSGSVIPIDLTQPDSALATLQRAVEAKGLSSADVAYRQCFADSSLNGVAFHAFFWPEDVSSFSTHGQVPSDWTLVNEMPFYNVGDNALVNLRPEPYQMIWKPDSTQADTPNPGNPPSVTLHRFYRVIAVGDNGAVAGIIAQGYADLLLVDFNNTWVITRWQDRADPAADPAVTKTWGLRRLESL